MARLDSLVGTRPPNAVLSWALVVALVGGTVERLLAGDLLWAGFSAAVIAVALVPTVLAADATVVVAWEVLALSALPALARVAGAFVQPLGYLSVAALGLLVVAEIDRFTDARMPPWFAAALVVMATMTVASSWTIVRYFAASALGTPAFASVPALMWDLVAASAVGVLAGVGFGFWLRTPEVT